MADKKTRTTLENHFASGKIPTESNFAELIASGINQIDDGLQKAADTPLAIRTTAPADAPRDMILFFEDFQQSIPQWRIRLRSGSLELSEGGNADFLIDKNGNVGIGTADPKGKLDVKGHMKATSLRVEQKVSIGGGEVFEVDLPIPSGTYIPGGRFKINSNGDVGIGTTEPIAKLDVNGNIKATSLRVEQKVSIGGGEVFEVDAPNISGGRFTINKRGNVGIGTKDPLGPLSIGDSSVEQSDGFLVIGKKKGGDTRHFKMGFDDNYNFTLGDYGHTNIAGTWKKPFAIHYAAPDSSFYMDSVGKVGIGTNAPKAKLQVVGGAIMPAEGSGESAGILFMPDAFGGSGDRAYIRYYARSGENTTLEIGNLNDADDHIALMPGGYVGIGTTAPAAKLHVDGPIMEKMDVIKCGGRGDWSALNHPIMQYFKGKLANKPVGTIIKALTDLPDWKTHLWQGWVDVDERIRVTYSVPSGILIS